MSYQKLCDVCGRGLNIGAPCHALLTNESIDICLDCCSPALMGAFVDKLRARALAADSLDGSVSVSKPAGTGVVKP